MYFTEESATVAAQAVVNKYSYDSPAYVTVNKLNENSIQCFYAFLFYQGDKIVGQWYQNTDGSFFKISKIIQKQSEE